MAFVRAWCAGVVAALAAGLVLLSSGCGNGEAATPSPVPTVVSPVQQLAELLGSGVDVDYEPLASPAEAIELADLIVTGVIVDVSDEDPPWEASQRVFILDVEVTSVLSGESVAGVGGIVRVALLGRGQNTAPALREAIVPVAGVYILHEAGADEFGEPIYTPYPEGIWLDDPTASRPLQGVYVRADVLPSAWGGPLTLDDLIARLDEAASP